MRVLVERAARWTGQPCAEAEPHAYIARRRFFLMPTDDPEKRWPDWKLVSVDRHTDGAGYALMEQPAERWLMDIPDLDALVAFMQREGGVVLRPTSGRGEDDPSGWDGRLDSDGGPAAVAEWELTIYDGYIE